MILDRIENADRYADLTDIGRALTVLAGLFKEERLPQQRVEVDGDHIFINPVTLTSKPREECVYEAHQNYIDIHFIVRGQEGIATASVETLSPMGAFDPQRDIGFYAGPESAYCTLKPGWFMVCWPDDAHMVAIAPEEPARIEKLVAKVRVT